MLGHRHRVKTLRSLGHVHVAAHEVHQIGALHQQLRHPGVVIAFARNVTIGAHLGFGRAHRVRIVRAEAEAAEPLRRDGLLHVINPVAIGVLRAHHHRARRARGRDAMLGHRAVHAQHVDVVAQHFKVVRGVVARGLPFVVQHGQFAVGRHRKMAAETAGGPRGVARIAGHAFIGMRQLRFIARHRAPGRSVLQHRFRQPRFFVVVRIARRDGVHHLHHFPRRAVFIHHRALIELALPASRTAAAATACAAARDRCRPPEPPRPMSAALLYARSLHGNPRNPPPPRCAFRRTDSRRRDCPAGSGNRCSACPFSR